MSDINLTLQENGGVYLAITETPSVVTLSQAVISGALASTVTVANTVTVALDANSLSALENVTVTVGAAVSVGNVVSVNVVTMPALSISSVSISNFPSTQTIAGTVTANVLISNVNGGPPPAGFPVVAYDETISGGAQIVPVQLNFLDGTVETNNPLPISGTVTANIGNTSDFIGGGYTNLTEVLNDGAIVVQSIETDVDVNNVQSVSILPPITGTVTANVVGKDQSGTPYSIPVQENDSMMIGTAVPIGYNSESDNVFYNISENHPLPISGTVTANVMGYDPANQEYFRLPLSDGGDAIITSDLNAGVVRYVNAGGTSAVSSSNPFPVKIQNSVTISGVVTAGALKVLVQEGSDQYLDLVGTSFGNTGAAAYAYCLNTTTASALQVKGSVSLVAGTAQIGSVTASIFGTPTVTMGAISGTVTVSSTTVTVSALPNGALTTRFGSVTTANTSILTSCVTNSSRKYLLAQNISAGTVTIGIGFSPTTTQGIQLSAGGGISFDSFCPTGAVWWLGATTGANFTILEG